jgi:hypothetical protein
VRALAPALGLLLAACGPGAQGYVPAARQRPHEDPYYTAPRVDGVLQPQLAKPAVRTVRRRVWPQPDLTVGRYLKAQDQYGCWWWQDTEGKYTSTWIVLTAGHPDCPSPKHYPAPEIVTVEEPA